MSECLRITEHTWKPTTSSLENAASLQCLPVDTNKRHESTYDRAVTAPELSWPADKRTGAPRWVHLSTSPWLSEKHLLFTHNNPSISPPPPSFPRPWYVTELRGKMEWTYIIRAGPFPPIVSPSHRRHRHHDGPLVNTFETSKLTDRREPCAAGMLAWALNRPHAGLRSHLDVSICGKFTFPFPTSSPRSPASH